jgi:hypothetical protein
VLLGIGLVIERSVPSLRLTTLVLLAAGVAAASLLGVWRWRWAAAPAVVLLGWGIGQLIEDLALLPGEGWSPLLPGLGLLGVWAAGGDRSGRRWALWLGGLFALIGAAQLTQTLGRVPGLEFVVPVALVAAGAVLLAAALRRPRGPRGPASAP